MDKFDLRKWPGFHAAGGVVSLPALIDHVAIDSKRIYAPGTLFVALKGSRSDGHCYLREAAQNGASYALVSCEYKGEEPENLVLLKVADPLLAFQEMAAVYRAGYSGQVVAITGSYGKTMAKDLVFAILQQSKRIICSPESFNSQIGVPLSLFRLTSAHDIALIEAGISMEGEMMRLKKMIQPNHVVITNVGKKHWQSLRSRESTIFEMTRLLEDLPQGGWRLLPEDIDFTAESDLNYCWKQHDKHFPRAEKKRLAAPVLSLQFPGGEERLMELSFGCPSYFLDLVNISIKTAWLLGSSSLDIEQGIRSFSSEPIRTESWKMSIGARVINDSYCGDPQSVDLALRRLEEANQKRKIFVFGGIKQSALSDSREYSRIGKAIEESRIHKLLLVGKHPYDALKKELIEKIKEKKLELLEFSSLPEALKTIREELSAEDALLIKGEEKPSQDLVTSNLEGSIYTTRCFINLTAVQTNLTMIRRQVGPHVRIMAVIKAAAYGTDPLKMAQFLGAQGIDIFSVSYVDEGVFLKRAGISEKIFVVNAAIYEISKVVEWGFEIGVSDIHFIQALAKEASSKNRVIKVHIHVDTGMSRLGCRPEDVLDLAQEIIASPYLILEGIMTHFSSADNPEHDAFTKKQMARFDDVIQQVENLGVTIPWKHAANSSGTLRFDLKNYNMIRVGLALYGLNPFYPVKEGPQLKCALSLQSRIVGINTCKRGESVSYGRSYQVDKDKMKVAVVPVGYFDGLHRSYSGKGIVMIHGIKAAMVGNICMDYVMVDISHIPSAGIGDSVLFFGEDEAGNFLPPEELALQGGTIPHELMACLGPRIQRVFIYEENASSC